MKLSVLRAKSTLDMRDTVKREKNTWVKKKSFQQVSPWHGKELIWSGWRLSRPSESFLMNKVAKGLYPLGIWMRILFVKISCTSLCFKTCLFFFFFFPSEHISRLWIKNLFSMFFSPSAYNDENVHSLKQNIVKW